MAVGKSPGLFGWLYTEITKCPAYPQAINIYCHVKLCLLFSFLITFIFLRVVLVCKRIQWATLPEKPWTACLLMLHFLKSANLANALPGNRLPWAHYIKLLHNHGCRLPGESSINICRLVAPNQLFCYPQVPGEAGSICFLFSDN